MKRDNRPQIESLEAKIGHRFKDRALIERALTHASALAALRAPPPTAISGWNFSATGCWVSPSPT